MQFKPQKGVLKLVLYKPDIEQMLNVTYLLQMVPRNLPDYPQANDLLVAVDTIRRFVKREGSKFLDEHGAIKRPAEEKAADQSVPTEETPFPPDKVPFGVGDGA